MMNSFPYIPGSSPVPDEPLSRFLPPIPVGVTTHWLEKTIHIPQEQVWIMDPFCASPRLVIETAQAGWRILVAANNPIHRFLLETYANPPDPDTFQSVMAILSSLQRGNDRLESHIRSLYEISCIECQEKLEVDAFLWEKDAHTPYGYQAECKACGAKGERNLLPEDANKAERFSVSGLHRARAMERVVSLSDPDRIHVEEAVSVYLPRALYVLFTILNKIDSLSLTQEQRTAVEALFIQIFDASNNLWAYPGKRARPRQLITPTKFKEFNIWKSLESGIDLWKTQKEQVEITRWPDLPTGTGGICLFEGPLRDLSEKFSSGDQNGVYINAIISTIPRPNQSFWTLSALWSGWLWGNDAVQHFRSVLRRRRYDWHWLYHALHSVYNYLAEITPTGIPMLSLTGEAETGLLTASLVAAGEAGFSIEDICLRGTQAQLYSRYSNKTIEKTSSVSDMLSSAIYDYLTTFGQPAPFLNLWSSAIMRLDQAGSFRPDSQDGDVIHQTDAFTKTQSLIRDAITFRGGLLRFGSSDNIESSLFWPRETKFHQTNLNFTPFGDRIEIEVVNFLVREKAIDLKTIESQIFDKFRGLMTPDELWVPIILNSYATETEPDSDIWHLRSEDKPSNRRQDLTVVQEQLEKLATKLGYTQIFGDPITWIDSLGETRFWFYSTASAVITETILGSTERPTSPPSRSIIVIPGSRANLILFKLQRDPRLAQLCHIPILDQSESNLSVEGWRFLKFRHLRRLLDDISLSQQPIDHILNLDPLTFSTPQMRLL